MPDTDEREAIVRDLARTPDQPTVGQYGVVWKCVVCRQKGGHAEDCPMDRARQWVAEHPEWVM